MLITMSYEKLGDFLLLTPYLQEIQKHRDDVTIAIPGLLYELYQEEKIFSDFIHNKEVIDFVNDNHPQVLDLSYPLLKNLQLPDTYLRLEKEIFKIPQHATESYSQALRLWFKELSKDFKAKPFFNLDTDQEVLKRHKLKPFHYFTVHSGSDFPSKNWSPENFEVTVELILTKYPKLHCVNLVGPQDQEIFSNKRPPERFQTVREKLRDVAHLLSASLFHVDNDSGVHHLAGVIDVPSITVFGPTGPGTWCSMTDYNFVHWGGPACENHCEGEIMHLCTNKVCLTSVKPEYLIESADKILSRYEVVLA